MYNTITLNDKCMRWDIYRSESNGEKSYKKFNQKVQPKSVLLFWVNSIHSCRDFDASVCAFSHCRVDSYYHQTEGDLYEILWWEK